MGIPNHYREQKPTAQSVWFAGAYINLTRFAQSGPFAHSYLSYIFKGVRTPSLAYARRLSVLLGMTLDQFMAEVEASRARNLGKKGRKTA